MTHFKLGSKLEDKVSGFTGIAIARVEYLNGCIQYHVKARLNKNGEAKEEWFDVGQLKLVEEDAVEIESRDTGGSTAKAPKSLNPGL